MKDKFAYVGTLRNEKLFNINDNIFFAYNDHDIIKGKIVGVELPPDENPEYKYKIRIPPEFIEPLLRESDKDYKNTAKRLKYLSVENITCSNIFSSVKEAKESAIKNLEVMFKLQQEEIERYFEQFGLTNKLK